MVHVLNLADLKSLDIFSFETFSECCTENITNSSKFCDITFGLMLTTFSFCLSLNLMSAAVLAYSMVTALKELCAHFLL